MPTFALPQALSAASVVVFSIAFGSQPLAALVSNFTSFLSNLISALVAFGGIPAGLSASEVVVVTSTEVFLNFFLSNFGVALPPSSPSMVWIGVSAIAEPAVIPKTARVSAPPRNSFLRMSLLE